MSTVFERNRKDILMYYNKLRLFQHIDKMKDYFKRANIGVLLNLGVFIIATLLDPFMLINNIFQ